MGGFGSMIASQASQDTFTGFSTGWNIGSNYQHARYNASAMREQANSLAALTDLQADLIAARYRRQYRELQYKQEMQMSSNRVYALKNGITGASAANVLGSYAAKNTKNLQTLYYNAAMEAGALAYQSGARMASLKEKARQYDWQATMTLVGGAINLATGYFKNNMPTGSTNDPTLFDAGALEDNAVKDEGASSDSTLLEGMQNWFNSPAGPSFK
ncbi:MAG: hypothetical protein J5838_02610 [Desulfovibrio sp.]|nr:hypothetical protein [Desulfovibrio sp.]